MIEQILVEQEGKTVEFKENTASLQRIIQTVIAFANTAGGVIVVGVKDKTKEVVGLEDVLKDEERIANAVADTVQPALHPQIQMVTWRERDLIVIQVDHSFGPYFLKAKGMKHGTFVRFGSTNRLADEELIKEIQMAKGRRYFDEIPNYDCPMGEIDFVLAKSLFQRVNRDFNEKTADCLHLRSSHQGQQFPTNGAVVLFGKDPQTYLPSALIRLAKFKGTDKAEFIDLQDVSVPIVQALDPILDFIRRHTEMAVTIGPKTREELPQYHPVIVREVVVNALLHTDYSLKGTNIQIALFDDRLEISNPGGLPFGLSLEKAISGISLLRNHVIGRVFREFRLAEQWGSGLRRILRISKEENLPQPQFEEYFHYFRVTIYHNKRKNKTLEPWGEKLIQHLQQSNKITPKEAVNLWNVSDKTANTRLKKLAEIGVIVELGTGPYDPHKFYRLSHER